MYAIVIPYLHDGPERFDNLLMTIKSIPDYMNIFIHETGTSPKIFSEISNISNVNYYFSEWYDVFHRAWSINKSVRNLPSTFRRLIIMDGDVLLPNYYFQTIEDNWKPFQIGWNELFYLSQLATLNYKHTGIINENPDLSVTKYFKIPEPRGACGGITLIDRDVFENVKGIPEDFRGTWGREDNAFVFKMMHFGYEFNTFPARIYHLHHSKRTIKNKEIQNKFLTMQYWDRKSWEHHNSVIGDNWGK